MIRRSLVALALLALLGTACGGGSSKPVAVTTTTTTTRPAPAVYPGYTSAVYADAASWLCRPDKDDVCDSKLDATAVEADGSTKAETWKPAADPAIDCFYVYPTISKDPGANSDMVPGEGEELLVVRNQAARLGSVCRVYAPIYRQGTLTALASRLGGKGASGTDSRAIAYGDVLDAWKHYIANDNKGRGVIIIGHSQGAGLLGELLKSEIDPNAALRARLVSAMIIGATQHASDYTNVKPCASDSDTGCLIAYSTFRANKPPPAGSFFARPGANGEPAVCTNPASLGGGSADLHAYFPSNGASIIGGSSTTQWGATVDTPFVTLPGLVSGKCAVKDGFSYLELTVHGDPSTPRIDDIKGDLTPEWGMHLIDVNVTMGDLVAVAAAEAKAYAKK